ncbi:DUF4956 domain-containing protein [Butyrivibrio sp. YAB3001]|uniref:DUF4956 domain-containing protein n=1 Tax=Butyrivibrio sp. YAB3001 TaxID=1520812 RepID=UPI0008F634C0|nr:DUF4956 domain-containing protein [Butyrivibrio sp. YAB3001]SFB76403.1 protein of unknown function [Butyrivibrio sp. YAB3001]
MSVKDVLRKSFLENYSASNYDVVDIAIALTLALLLGILIYLVYRRFYAGVIFSKSFAITLIGMCVLTCMVTLAISSNVVISLGMVGALSIVRFRTAIKDPLDLLYLFWAITTGITSGAGMYILTLVSAVIMIIMIAIFYSRVSNNKIYVAVIHYEGVETGDEVLRAFGKKKYHVKSKTMKGNTTELAVEVNVKGDDLYFEEKIQKIDKVKDITIIQYNGEYNA